MCEGVAGPPTVEHSLSYLVVLADLLANRASQRTHIAWRLQQGAAAACGVVRTDGSDAREHGGVRVGEEDVKRVRREVGEVLARELLERTWPGSGLGSGERGRGRGRGRVRVIG